tara:strand:+ start:303 stop:413 length:111 start_codon:yes stop_codon:yes gene_type:complete
VVKSISGSLNAIKKGTKAPMLRSSAKLTSIDKNIIA